MDLLTRDLAAQVADRSVVVVVWSRVSWWAAFERSDGGRQRARLWTRQRVPGADGRYVWDRGSYQGHEVALGAEPSAIVTPA